MSDAIFWRGSDDANDRGVGPLDEGLDRIFTLFSHSRRRALLYLLRGSDAEPLWTTNLAVELARMETAGVEDVDDAAEEIALSLRHNHLPKLAEAGVIDVDSTATTVTYRGDDRVDDLLQWSGLREGSLSELLNE